MPSTYTSNLQITKIGIGEQEGQWGNTTNLNFDIIDEAVNGTVAVNITSPLTSGSPNILPITQNSLSDGRNFSIELTGSPGGDAFIRLDPNTAEKIGYIKNSFGDGSLAIIFQGSYNAARDYSLLSGYGAFLKFDGAGSGSTVTNLLQSHIVDGTLLAGNVTVSSGGTLDAAGATVDVSSGTLTLANNQISGNAIDGGIISNFASTGIDDNATSTAITVDANENVGINVTDPDAKLEISLADTDTSDYFHGGGFRGLRINDTTKTNSGDVTNFSKSSTSGEYTFNNSNGELMRIGSGGSITVTGTVDGRNISADGTKLDGIDDNANNYALPKATAAVRGGVELGSNTVQTVAANSVSATAGKTYAVQLNSADQMVVNVPWSDSTNPGTVTSVDSGTGLTGGPITTSGTLSLATAGAGAGTYGSTANGTKIDQITLDAYGRVTAITTGATGSSSTTGTVTSVSGANGISGTVTTSGNLTLDSDLRSHVFQIGRDTNDYYIVNTTNHAWYLDGVLDMQLSNAGQLDVDGNVVAYSTSTASDAKLKDDVETLDNALDTVEKLRGVSFTWNDQTRFEGKKDIGVIAQEVQDVLPELVQEVETIKKEGETHLTVDYPKLTAVLIEAVKELSAEVKALKEAK